MDKRELAERYTARIKRCFLAVKICIGIAVAGIAALLVFICVAAATDMQSANPAGVLTGVIAAGVPAVLAVMGAFTGIIIAAVTLKKLTKLGAD